jgi:hypothetical protein
MHTSSSVLMRTAVTALFLSSSLLTGVFTAPTAEAGVNIRVRKAEPAALADPGQLNVLKRDPVAVADPEAAGNKVKRAEGEEGQSDATASEAGAPKKGRGKSRRRKNRGNSIAKRSVNPAHLIQRRNPAPAKTSGAVKLASTVFKAAERHPQTTATLVNAAPGGNKKRSVSFGHGFQRRQPIPAKKSGAIKLASTVFKAAEKHPQTTATLVNAATGGNKKRSAEAEPTRNKKKKNKNGGKGADAGGGGKGPNADADVNGPSPAPKQQTSHDTHTGPQSHELSHSSTAPTGAAPAAPAAASGGKFSQFASKAMGAIKAHPEATNALKSMAGKFFSRGKGGGSGMKKRSADPEAFFKKMWNKVRGKSSQGSGGEGSTGS